MNMHVITVLLIFSNDCDCTEEKTIKSILAAPKGPKIPVPRVMNFKI